MRTIKFKGKRLDNNEWIYGDLINRKIWASNLTLIRFDDNGFDNFVEYEVDVKTVGQFTGLVDKNGTEIYEGDIIKDHSEHRGRVVKFGKLGFDSLQNGLTGFALLTWLTKEDEEDGGDYYELSYYFNPREMEVIGNKHDNPHR